MKQTSTETAEEQVLVSNYSLKYTKNISLK